MNWREILNALDRRNTKCDRELSGRLNAQYGGPSIWPRQGGQPRVDKGKLLPWWNWLETVWITEGQGENARTTVENQHPHGRNGVVVPDISGAVKRRRQHPGEQRRPCDHR